MVDETILRDLQSLKRKRIAFDHTLYIEIFLFFTYERRLGDVS
jgi:hypothetical protein